MADDETLPESVLAEYEKYALGADDVSHAFSYVKDVINVFFLDGDSVKFSPSFHNCIQIADCVFPRLITEACLFLGFELANHVAAYKSHGLIFVDEDAEKLNIQNVDIHKKKMISSAILVVMCALPLLEELEIRTHGKQTKSR